MTVSRVGVADTVPAGTASFTATLPTHAAGDRLTLTVQGKYDTATVPTIDNGWTLVGSGTGGTGATGNDVGPTFWAVYAKDAASGSEAAPTVTAGGTAPNSWLAICASHRFDTGKEWRDAIGASAAWVAGGSDTNTASPLTASAAVSVVATGDALFSTGAVPTNSGGITSNTFDITATGLSGGTKAVASGQYQDTTLNANFGIAWLGWTGFTGPSSADPVPSYAINTSTNHSGAVVVLALREQAAGGGGTDATVNASAIATVSTLPAPTIQTGSSVTPAAIATVSTLPAATLQTGSTASPSAIATVSTVPAATVQTGSTVSPAAIATVSTLPAPNVSTGTNATASPAAIATVSTLPAPTVQTGSTASPAAIATVSTLPAPDVSGSSTASPAAIATVSTLPAPTVQTGSTVTPTAIATVSTLPTPTVESNTATGIKGNAYPRTGGAATGNVYPRTSGGIIGQVG